MSNITNQSGYFLFSLDTELGWGFYDLDQLRYQIFSPDGSKQREAIERLLDIFDEFGITATWAVTGHLFYEKCEECEICPILDWEGKYRSFEEIYKTQEPLWYGADIIDNLISRATLQDIAFHGYTHQLFDEQTMDEDAAKTEVREWLRVSSRRGILPSTVIFPRNVIGHMKVFEESGFICYRGREVQPMLYRIKFLGKLFKHLDHIFSFSIPHVYDLNGISVNGMVNLYSSQDFFGFNRNVEMVLDSINLDNVRFNRIIKTVKKAANEKKIVHITAHPWEFKTDKDLDKLRYLLGYVVEDISAGRLQSIGMTELAKKVISKDIINTKGSKTRNQVSKVPFRLDN